MDVNQAATAAQQSSCCNKGAATAQSSITSTMHSIAPIALMIVAFYFLLIRPQQKKDAKKREMLSGLQKGDQIVTICGIICTVHKVINEKEVAVEIAEGVRIRLLKTAIAEVVSHESGIKKNENIDDDIADNKKKKPKKTSQNSASEVKAKNVSGRSK